MGASQVDTAALFRNLGGMSMLDRDRIIELQSEAREMTREQAERVVEVVVDAPPWH